MCAASTTLTSPHSRSPRSTAAACKPALHRRALDAVGELVAAKRPALIPIADRIARELGIGGQRLRAVVLGPALRPIAEAERRAVVPPAARIVGRAVED